MKRVSSQELKRIFDEKGVKLVCECCGHNDWAILTNLASLIVQDSEANGLSSYPIVALECKNCGNLKLFGRTRFGIGDN